MVVPLRSFVLVVFLFVFLICRGFCCLSHVFPVFFILFHSFFFFGGGVVPIQPRFGENSAEIWREQPRIGDFNFSTIFPEFSLTNSKKMVEMFKSIDHGQNLSLFSRELEKTTDMQGIHITIFSMSYIYVSWYELVKTYLFWSCFG